MAYWYALQYKPGQGDRAVQNLQNQEITCFHPKITVEKVRAGKRVKKQEPLFPGYLFVQLSHTDPKWAKLRSTRGIVRVVGFGFKPAPIADSVIKYIADGLHQVSSQGGLKPGQVVEVTSGPFAGCEAIFEAHDGEERAILLIDIMHKTHALSLQASDIKA